MLTLTLLTLNALAAPDAEQCEQVFFEKIFAEGGPRHRPPLRPLLEFAWDVDDSGALDPEERAALDRDIELRCAALEDLAAELDTDGDGSISRSEREALRDRFGPPPPRPPHGDRPSAGVLPPPLMRAFDTNGDRHLSSEEKRTARTDVQDRFRNGLPPVAHAPREHK